MPPERRGRRAFSCCKEKPFLAKYPSFIYTIYRKAEKMPYPFN
jgi:hypothetical protein